MPTFYDVYFIIVFIMIYDIYLFKVRTATFRAGGQFMRYGTHLYGGLAEGGHPYLLATFTVGKHRNHLPIERQVQALKEI